MVKKTFSSQDLLKNLQIGVFRCTAGTKPKFQYINTFCCKLLGLSEHKSLEMDVEEVFEEPKKFKALLSDIRKNGDLIQKQEMIIKKSRGMSIPVALSLTPVFDQRKKVEFVDVVVEDISSEKQYQMSLNESKELFRIIFENSAVAILVVGEDGSVVAWNPAFQSMVQLSPEDLFNKPFKEFLSSEDWKKLVQKEKRSKDSVINFESRICLKKNKAIDANLSVSPMVNANNKIVGSIIIIQDISKQKKTQDMLVQAKMAAEEANEAKSLFLAKMSHEVRTPMNAVIGMIDITLDGNLTIEQRDNLKVAKDAADNLLELLNDILDLSKAESGKVTVESIEVNLHEMVMNVCKGLSILANKKNIQLKWSIAKDVPRFVKTDPTRVRQILINLVNNAVKFTHHGEVKVVLDLDKLEQDICMLQFSVQDTGIGIPPDRQEAIFDIFSQADNTTTRKYGGTGLGLAICRKLCKLMGGDIWLNSEVGKGSHFNFTIECPVIKKDEQLVEDLTGAVDMQSEIIEGQLGHSIRILLAEDNLVNQRIAVKILEKRGWDVTAVENGVEVLEALKERDFDLILMDDQMPELTGKEATQRIREEEVKTGNHIPIIAMTAHAMAGDREKYLASGMDGYVSKPIKRDALYGEIISLMTKKRINV